MKLSAAFGRLNPGPECRRASACELLRICAPGGGVLLMQGKRDEARQHLQRALELDPGMAEARQNLALLK